MPESKITEIVESSNSLDLKKVVSALPDSELKLPSKKKDRKIKEFRPLPSINVMRKRVSSHLIELVKKNFSKLSKKTPVFELSNGIAEVRIEARKIKGLKKLTVQEIKDFYFRLFGYRHGIKSENNI